MRGRGEPEVASGRVAQVRVGDPRMAVHAGLLPSGPGQVAKPDPARCRTPGCVAGEGHVQLAPVASEQGPAVPDHDVALEAKALVRLDPRALDLRVAAKGEDVVAHHVLL